MRLRGVIFDLDGTLGNTIPICIQSLQETILTHSGRALSSLEIQALFGPNEEGILQKALPGSPPEVYNAYLELYDRLHAACSEPFEGVAELLSGLRARGTKTAIVSGKSAETAVISLRHMGLSGQFDAVVTGFPDRADKPAQLREVQAEWGLPAGELAYVGDAPSDLAAARAVGMTPLGAAWADSSTLRGYQAQAGERVFASVSELAAWLAGVLTA